MQGQIIKRGEGRWLVRVFLGRDGNGKRLYKAQTVHGTKREAETFLAGLLREIGTGTYVAPSNTTLGDFLARWLEDYARASTRPSTYTSYRLHVRVHIAPDLGHVPLAKLTPLHLQRLYRKHLDAGLAPATVRRIHAVLHRALKTALKWGLVSRNVADAVELPKLTRPEMTVLDADGARRLLEAARGDRLYALWLLALATGMRQGELLGLRWQDVDLERGALSVRQTAQYVRGRGITFGAPKTAKGLRRLDLTPELVEALRRHRARQAEERLAAGAAYTDHGLVFCTQIGTPMNGGNLVRRDFQRLLQKAGLPPMRFHDLRHTSASLLLSQGVHLKVIQARLGHSSIQVTGDVYAHLLPDMSRDAAAKLETLLLGQGPKKTRRQG